MKNILLVPLFVLFISSGQAQGIHLNEDIFRQVYLVQYEQTYGSSFIIDIDKKEFLITAAHLFPNISNNSELEITIYDENKSEINKIRLYKHSDPSIDIAVVVLQKPIKKMNPLITGGSIEIGQNLLFLGYPILNGQLFATQDPAFGIRALVKKAMLSGVIKKNNYYLMLLDGHNNSGFSGGPVIGYDKKTDKNIIIGVISGYVCETKKVYNDNKSPTLNYDDNSGIILSYSIDLAYQIIDENNLAK